MTGVPCASLRRWYWIASIIACFWNLSLGGVNHNVVHPALPMIINPTELSILSIQFNPKPGIFSDWVVPTFGEKAVFHNRSYDARLRTKLQPQEIEERSALFKTFFKLPEQALNTSCSFEFLGFVPVNTHRPFTWGDKEYRPSIGVGSLLVGEAEDWDCYYRGLYENPLHSLTQYKNQHWPIVFFCPARNDRISCANALAVNDLAKRQDPPSKLALRLSLPLHDVTWSVDMAVDLLAVQRKDPPKSNQAALCTAIPYTTSIPERFEVSFHLSQYTIYRLLMSTFI